MRSNSAPHGSFRIREAIGVRRSVATFQPHLVCAQPIELDEKLFIQAHPTLRVRVDLDHPTLYAIWIELLVPRRVQRVGEINALSVAADLDHLRRALQLLTGLAWVRRAAHDATHMDRTRLLRVGGIGDVVLDELASPPARNVEESVVE